MTNLVCESLINGVNKFSAICQSGEDAKTRCSKSPCIPDTPRWSLASWSQSQPAVAKRPWQVDGVLVTVTDRWNDRPANRPSHFSGGTKTQRTSVHSVDILVIHRTAWHRSAKDVPRRTQDVGVFVRTIRSRSWNVAWTVVRGRNAKVSWKFQTLFMQLKWITRRPADYY